MAIDIITSGTEQNSYVSLSEANALLLTMHTGFMELGEQLDEATDAAYLLEAANDLETLWRWTGQPTAQDQPLAWPRTYVSKPGWQAPGEPGWSVPYSEEDFMQYKVDYLSGNAVNAQYLPDTAVPRGIKEAQALIAMLRKKNGNLIGDSQDDAQGIQLGPVKVAYVNAVRKAADIHKRTAQLGRFIGEALLRTANG